MRFRCGCVSESNTEPSAFCLTGGPLWYAALQAQQAHLLRPTTQTQIARDVAERAFQTHWSKAQAA